MTAFDLQPFFPYVLVAVFLFGLAFGSFLNVCIYRMPRELSVVRPRSACPHCHALIRGYDNIPILSWLILRGRCRNCEKPISPRYLFVELLTALLFVACFARFGISLAAVKYCVFSFLLTGLIFTDLDCKLLPDLLTLPGMWLGFLFALLTPMPRLATLWIPWTWWMHLPPGLVTRAQSLLESLVGAGLGALLIYGAGWMYLKVRGVEGMGFGDVKMMAMVGAFVGPALTLLTIGGASLLATCFGLGSILVVWVKRVRRRRSRGKQPLGAAMNRAWASAQLIYRFYEIPFGSFLGVMALLSFFYGVQWYQWYMELWRLPS